MIEAQNMEEHELRNHRKLADLIKAHGVSNIAFKFCFQFGREQNFYAAKLQDNLKLEGPNFRGSTCEEARRGASCRDYKFKMGGKIRREITN